ncbi:hypothetical protein Tco_0854077 [Tanacetum coccineum]
MPPRKAPRTRTAPATTTNTTSITNARLQAMIDQGVNAALAARNTNRSTNGEDSHNLGTGTEGVVELTQWFERMETVFRISNCSMENQTKFSTCTLPASALTWWNSYVMTVGHDVANGIKKLEAELWNLKVKGTDVIGYNQRFQELALLCVRMVPEESDKVESWQAAPQWAMYCKVAELQEDWPHDSGLHYIVIAAGAKEPDPMETMQQGSTKRFTYPIEELICRQALAFSWLRLHFEDKASFCQGTLYSNHGSRSQTVKAKPCPNGQSLMEL